MNTHALWGWITIAAAMPLLASIVWRIMSPTVSATATRHQTYEYQLSHEVHGAPDASVFTFCVTAID